MACSPTCLECQFPNTNNLVFGFYLNGVEAQGQCQRCGPNTELKDGLCKCLPTYYLNEENETCEKCSSKCEECRSFELCDRCISEFIVTSSG